ncbi:hypothetical protein [Sorangium sp. So ce1099]|uniref:hypothetical protein n=1 Tax=Sorangium sp. So ce1099 TaxID=3133331 RepID=UPI003F6227B4
MDGPTAARTCGRRSGGRVSASSIVRSSSSRRSGFARNERTPIWASRNETAGLAEPLMATIVGATAQVMARSTTSTAFPSASARCASATDAQATTSAPRAASASHSARLSLASSSTTSQRSIVW